MQRAGVESILGVRLEGGVLCIDPCIPKAWTGFDVSLRHGASRYDIRVENPDGVERGVAFASLDGATIPTSPLRVALCDDGAIRRIVVRLGWVAATPVAPAIAPALTAS
jgi:cyclic beta-1,2-glucan synthetase